MFFISDPYQSLDRIYYGPATHEAFFYEKFLQLTHGKIFDLMYNNSEDHLNILPPLTYTP